MNRITLFCFPFAGGSDYSYKELNKFALPVFDVINISLPGRGKRSGEQLVTNIDVLIEDLFNQVIARINGPYLFYGHSMGALLAYLLSKEIIRRKLPAPVYLFFTGCAGPSAENHEAHYFQLPKLQFIEAIKEMEGIPPDVLADELLLDYLEPILRADFEITGTYRYENTLPFDIPVAVMIGMKDLVSYDDALLWQLETTQLFEIKQLPGNHFFIFGHEMEIVKLMYRRTLAQITL
jgi:surfactin synthase thioesterase subunit